MNWPRARGECEKGGCWEPAELLVVLNDPDGTMRWWACKPHALEFNEWVKREVNGKPDGFLVSVYAGPDEELPFQL